MTKAVKEKTGLDPILENEDLKDKIEQLEKELSETKQQLKQCDAMLGQYVEKFKLADARVVWFEVQAQLSQSKE